MSGLLAKKAGQIITALKAVQAGRFFQVLLDVVLCAALFLLYMLSRGNAERIGSTFTPYSLRYYDELSPQSAYQAMEWAVKNSDSARFWPAFWSEINAEVESEFSKTGADVIYYSGDESLVWDARYLSGSAPGFIETRACAVSTALAYSLWGNRNVTGMSLSVEGESYTVSGVFEEEKGVALISLGENNEERAWQAAELSCKTYETTIDDAKSFAASSGLGMPDVIVEGESPYFLAKIAANIPPVFLLVCGVFWALRAAAGRYKTTKRVLGFLVLVSIVIMLPALLSSAPQWLIPDRWSDFSFFKRVVDSFAERAADFLAVRPLSRDVVCKTLLMKQAALFFLASVLAVAFAVRHSEKMLYNTHREDKNEE